VVVSLRVCACAAACNPGPRGKPDHYIRKHVKSDLVYVCLCACVLPHVTRDHVSNLTSYQKVQIFWLCVCVCVRVCACVCVRVRACVHARVNG